ncbi:MAG: hypothetical protein ACRDDH_17470 [Cetobacterium sp.]
MKINEIKTKLEAQFTDKELEYRVGATNADKTMGLALINIYTS